MAYDLFSVGAFPIKQGIAYHLFSVDANATNTNETVKLIRKSKGYSQHDGNQDV